MREWNNRKLAILCFYLNLRIVLRALPGCAQSALRHIISLSSICRRLMRCNRLKPFYICLYISLQRVRYYLIDRQDTPPGRFGQHVFPPGPIRKRLCLDYYHTFVHFMQQPPETSTLLRVVNLYVARRSPTCHRVFRIINKAHYRVLSLASL